MQPGHVVRNRTRSPWRYLWIPLILMWGAGFALFVTSWQIATPVLLFSAILAIGYHRHFGSRTLGIEGRVHQAGDRLIISDDKNPETRIEIDNRRIVGGFYNDSDRVVLELDDKTEYHIAVADRTHAEHVMTAAGVTVDRRALRVPIASPFGRRDGGGILGCTALTVAAIAAFATLGAQSLYAIPSLILVALCVRLLQRGQAIIGTDGILLTRALWGRKFIPYDDINALNPRYRRLELTTHGGERHYIAAHWADPFMPEVTERDDRWANKALHYRIVQAAARRQLGGEGISLEQLERQGRHLAAWHEALRRIGTAVGGYRDPAVMTQSLAAVVEDPAEHPERRVGAALALAESGPEARHRISLAADACADPSLARALKAAAGQRIDEEALQRASAIVAQRDRATRVRFGLGDAGDEAQAEQEQAFIEAADEEERKARELRRLDSAP